MQEGTSKYLISVSVLYHNIWGYAFYYELPHCALTLYAPFSAALQFKIPHVVCKNGTVTLSSLLCKP